MPRSKKPSPPAKPARASVKAKAPRLATPIEVVKHKDKRANIPTEELRDFVAEDEKQPKTILYPRDPSLDPQLVWKGKDEQDSTDLAVPAVPIYIQEKINPQAIIENVRAQAKVERPEPQMALFADFNGIAFEDLIDFYQHEQNWANRMILGDSLLVMTSLAEKEGLKGKVQTIYFDPPYGIKFGSNWQVSTRKRDVKDGKAEDATRQPEQIKAFRDTWQLGIHSYLAYLRDRLTVARELLTESGSVFVQIGDENVHLVRNVLDEVFGSENFCSIITFAKTGGQAGFPLTSHHDHLIWYAKNKTTMKFRPIYAPKGNEDAGTGGYDWIEQLDDKRRRLSEEERENPKLISADDRLFALGPLYSEGATSSGGFDIQIDGRRFQIPIGRHWKTNQAGVKNLKVANRLWAPGSDVRYIRYAEDFPAKVLSTVWDDTSVGGYHEARMYVVQTTTKVIERCLLMTTDPGDLVLDPTCGSGTTAYVAEQWGRRWISLDTSRVAIALARTRLMAGRFPYYILADSPEGRKKEMEINPTVMLSDLSPEAQRSGEAKHLASIGETLRSTQGDTTGDIKRGFVYKRVPHVTLKSIANNDEIDALHAKWQEQLEPLRARLNKLAKQNWQEWEVPREAPQDLAGLEDLRGLLAEWQRLRRERQKEIDQAIARHADTELLYDQPYEDNKRIRVTGPFTVESLSPHRVLAADDDRPTTEAEGQKQSSVGQFEAMIIENLKAAGVQNTVKKERLKFDRLEPFAGTWLHATGEYTENGKGRRVAVCIGPEHGTVGPDLVKEAAKEAVQGVGFDLLIVCGFAFDPHVSEEAKRYGKLAVLTARMNPDLAMGDELLKKTGAGNLFMVFGEPDVEVKRVGATGVSPGKIVVTVNGVDVYDPTTGQIRSSTTDDIACWFIDTDYNGESFFVRHAYFTGADEPYEKLKRALRAEIDEAAWSALYSTKSYPFDPPKSDKIAVKVINHYGDEVMKVYGV